MVAHPKVALFDASMEKSRMRSADKTLPKRNLGRGTSGVKMNAIAQGSPPVDYEVRDYARQSD